MKCFIIFISALFLIYTPAQAFECVLIKDEHRSVPADEDVVNICTSLIVIDPQDWNNYQKFDCERLTSTGLTNACFLY